MEKWGPGVTVVSDMYKGEEYSLKNVFIVALLLLLLLILLLLLLLIVALSSLKL